MFIIVQMTDLQLYYGKGSHSFLEPQNTSRGAVRGP